MDCSTVNPSIMSEAGHGTVELLVPVLCSLTEQREARCFTASPLGCLVQFTHPRKVSNYKTRLR
jgi:hypothetical protein